MGHALAQALGAAALALTLWAACSGVGARILPRPAPGRLDDALPSWNRPGVAACVGLAALLALGGAATVLRIPVWVILGPFLVVGVVLALVRLLGLSRRAASWLAVTISVVTIGAFALMALLESHIGLRMPINGCDELRAYLPMVRRLLDTHAIVEPWSYRRLQTLGGFTFLQAMHVSVLGDEAIGLAETLIASVFLGGLFVATGFRSAWTRIACLLFILAIPVLWIPRINTAPVLLTVPFLVAAFAGTAEIRAALRDSNRNSAFRWSIACGLLLAAIASVRAPTMPVAAVTVAIGTLTVSAASVKDRVRSFGVAAGAGLVAIGPWLLASWEAVGTPLYPLITGNANTSVPSERDPSIDTISEIVRNSWDFVRAGSFLWVVLAVVVFALVARKLLPDARLLVIIGLTTLVTIGAYSVSLSIASSRDFGRYIAPLGAGLAVFVFSETLRTLDRTLTARSTEATPHRSPLTAVLAVGIAVLALGAVFTPLAVRPNRLSPLRPSGWTQLDWDAVGGWVRANRITPNALDAEWRWAMKRIDPERTITAVDRPYLIDYSRFDLPNMDLPGWATPTGTFPFFRGPKEKIEYLRREGFTQLIATEPDLDQCLPPGYLQLEIQYFDPPDSLYARYFLDWESDVTAITKRAPSAVQKFGNLLIIDLPRAQAVLSRQAAAAR